MKRDMELIYKILAFYEEKEDFAKFVTPNIENYPKNDICYHLKLMSQSNLLEARNLPGTNGMWVASTLTNYGHDFFDALRQESIWNTIKSEFKEASLDTLISVAKQLTEAWAKKKLESLLGNKND